RRRHTRFSRDWSTDVCSSDLKENEEDLQKEQEGNVPQPLHLLAVSVSSPGGVIVRQQMLEQKKAHRYDTQQRVQPTVEKTGVIHCQAPHKPECFSLCYPAFQKNCTNGSKEIKFLIKMIHRFLERGFT